jgi:hypothetical protein
MLPAMPGCAAPAKQGARTVARSEKVVTLGAQPTRVTLKGPSVASRAESLSRGSRLFLVIGGLRADRDPGVTYDVYLDLPARATAAQRTRHYAGNVHFYSADPHFSFDITDLARALRKAGALREATTLTFVPDGKAVGSAFIDRIEIVEERAAP